LQGFPFLGTPIQDKYKLWRIDLEVKFITI
jgi:hypothetical protein